MAKAFYSIGHSTRDTAEFADLLRVGGVECVVDVRSVPRSRANPQFNGDALPKSLEPFGIGYSHLAELAGLRGKDKTVDDAVNGYWRNRSFHNYADYALTAAFQAGLATLLDLGRRETCAVMCAEAVWWRCHRRIIADYLLARGKAVYHLMDKDRVHPAKMTEAAQAGGNGKLVYPAHGDAPPS